MSEGNNALNVSVSLKDKNGSDLKVLAIEFISQNCATSSEAGNVEPFAVAIEPSSSLTGNTSIGGGESEFPLCIAIAHTENITSDENKMNVTISVSSFVDDTSTGLRYTKINGGKELSVAPIDITTLSGEVTIPETFNFDGEDLPITAFGSFSGSNITKINIPT